MTSHRPEQWRDRALDALRGGDAAAAKHMMVQGLAEHPQSAGLWNSAGDLHLRLGDPAGAERFFAQATELEPQRMVYAINRAVALNAVGKCDDAIAVLEPFADEGEQSAAYCSARGVAARNLHRPEEAARWFDDALKQDARHPEALHGRARAALERAAPEAPAFFDLALSVTQDDGDLWLGKAQSLDAAGESNAALELATKLTEQAPRWTEAQRFRAQLRRARGEADFAGHYTEAAEAAPQDPNIVADWCSVLASAGQPDQAAEIAAKAQTTFPDAGHFVLLEATFASAAGEDERAEQAFARLDQADSQYSLPMARHQLRTGEIDRAAELLDRELETDPWSVAAWALRGVVWRLTDDSRADWLHQTDRLVQMMPLHGADAILPKIIPLLHELHDGSPPPLGQSLRGGTQTRGRLFDRIEPEFAKLSAAIRATVDDYQSGLPACDPAHPLLRDRDAAWSLAGSWSVRLAGGGDFHTAHIHPEGIVSSALYLELPGNNDQSDPNAGWLEIGRPASDLRLDLEPLAILEPKTGHLALFPSILYHGTRRFSEQYRMTVAFDVTN